MSPELLTPLVIGSKAILPTIPSDCYSLGMVIYETISGHRPFYGDTDFMTTVKVLGGEYPRRGAGFTQGLWEMLERCWASQPSGRPSIEDVLQCLDICSNLPIPTPPEWHPGFKEMKHLPDIVPKFGGVDGTTQLPPVIYPHGTTFPHVGSRITGHARPPRDSPTTHNDQTAGYPVSSGSTSTRDYEFCDAMPPRSSDFSRACTPYTAVAGSCPPSDNTTLASPTVAREADPSSGTLDPLVSGLPEGIEDETAGSPSPGINNVASRNPKKRKQPETEEMPHRVKYGRQSISQHHVLQRTSIQV